MSTFAQAAGVVLQKANGAFWKFLGAENKNKLRGQYTVELVRGGQVIQRFRGLNGITNQGKDKILNDMFNQGTQSTSHFIGLIDFSGFTQLADGDTAAQINGTNGWNEFTTYSEGTRVEWAESPASGQSITNALPSVFNIAGSGTIKGVLVIDNNTKAGTTGTLWATALFASDVPVQNGDQLKVTYTVSA